MYNKQSGSVLTIILIVMVLFAAIGFAVMDGFRMSGGENANADKEKMVMALSEIRETVSAHRLTIQNMVMNGINVDNIDASLTGYYNETNADCTVDNCRIYSPSGGALKWQAFPVTHAGLTDIPNDISPANYPNGVSWVAYSYKGTTKADLVYYVRVSKAFCNFINKSLSITTDIDALPALSTDFINHLESGTRAGLGATAHNLALNGENSDTPHLLHKNEGCVKTSIAPIGYFYIAFAYAT